jgi:hypothetical protein
VPLLCRAPDAAVKPLHCSVNLRRQELPHLGQSLLSLYLNHRRLRRVAVEHVLDVGEADLARVNGNHPAPTGRGDVDPCVLSDGAVLRIDNRAELSDNLPLYGPKQDPSPFVCSRLLSRLGCPRSRLRLWLRLAPCIPRAAGVEYAATSGNQQAYDCQDEQASSRQLAPHANPHSQFLSDNRAQVNADLENGDCTARPRAPWDCPHSPVSPMASDSCRDVADVGVFDLELALRVLGSREVSVEVRREVQVDVSPVAYSHVSSVAPFALSRPRP